MDKINGPHRGKGPKGYTRSDARLCEDINDRLYHDPFVDASEIEVTVNNGEAVLTGTVDSREAKRKAEDIAESITGIKDVENHLKVNRTENTMGNTSARESGNNDSSRKKNTWL
jgi:osmotically-inducible protein OsmY